MTEKDIPEINVEKLMAKIREEAARRRPVPNQSNNESEEGSSPRLHLSDWNDLSRSLAAAESCADIGVADLRGARYPSWARPMARKVGRLVLFLTRIITKPQRAFNHQLLYSIRNIFQGTKSLEDRVNVLLAMIQALELKLIGEKNVLEERLQERRKQLEARLEEARKQMEAPLSELRNTNLQLKTILILQERRLEKFLAEAKKRLPKPFDKKQLKKFAEEEIHCLDAFYALFEDQFRGTREEIHNRARVYLPIIKKANLGTKNKPILDLGCGRGEWLELLKEKRLRARGVDTNRVFVEQGKQLGLEVVERDAIDYLKSLPNANVGVVTGFHLVEHLPFEILIQLLDETVRVLKPGGLAIFETPNPENVLVGSCNFYLDPTHFKPLPSRLMKFIAEARGLHRVEILNLNPPDASARIEEGGSQLASRFNHYFYGPQDYAIVGSKA